MKITEYKAAGRVCTGFSKPYVADYAAEQGVVTLSNPVILARGVSVNVSPEASSDNNFYADNQLAESAAGTFTGGTVTLTVDGLHTTAEKRIMGIPDRGADGWVGVGDDQVIPYVATGYVVRYMCGAVTMYRPEIIVKTKYNQLGTEANTQEDNIDWQTEELTAVIMRGDDSNHNWKLIGNDWSTETEAESELVARLGGNVTTYTVTQNLSGVTSSFTGTSVIGGSDFSATMTAVSGTVASITVTMGGTDVSETVVSGDTVHIVNVTGNIVITASNSDA